MAGLYKDLKTGPPYDPGFLLLGISKVIKSVYQRLLCTCICIVYYLQWPRNGNKLDAHHLVNWVESSGTHIQWNTT